MALKSEGENAELNKGKINVAELITPILRALVILSRRAYVYIAEKD